MIIVQNKIKDDTNAWFSVLGPKDVFQFATGGFTHEFGHWFMKLSNSDMEVNAVDLTTGKLHLFPECRVYHDPNAELNVHY